MAYGFKFTSEALSSEYEKINVSLTYAGLTSSYILTYDGVEEWDYYDSETEIVLSPDEEENNWVLLYDLLEAEDVGKEYTISINYAEVSENFASAVDSVLSDNEQLKYLPPLSDPANAPYAQYLRNSRGEQYQWAELNPQPPSANTSLHTLYSIIQQAPSDNAQYYEITKYNFSNSSITDPTSNEVYLAIFRKTSPGDNSNLEMCLIDFGVPSTIGTHKLDSVTVGMDANGNNTYQFNWSSVS